MIDITVTIQHLYSAPNFAGTRGFCGRGSRRWFEKYGLDWPAFVREGLPASVFEATGDPLALRLVEHARASQ